MSWPIPTSFAPVSTKPGDGATRTPERVSFLDYARHTRAAGRAASGWRFSSPRARSSAAAAVRMRSRTSFFSAPPTWPQSSARSAEDDSVVAVVLRIDSPGGSALASDLILREVDLLRAKKPVVVSMSDVAASGGYYIAARATRIVAEPATITGSIGVVTGKLATGRSQEELLGVTHDPLSARRQRRPLLAPQAVRRTSDGAPAPTRDEIYGRFLDHVAEGRALDRSAVEAVAAGRVWTGSDALAVGLVDELGGLDRAVALAREAAGTFRRRRSSR